VKVSNVFIVLALACVWVLLVETLSVSAVLTGLFFGIITLFTCNKALPVSKASNMSFSRMVMYPLFLVGQVYVAGFNVIKIIFSGATTEFVKIKTDIEDESLRVVLADSITLTPGSVLINLEGDELEVLWLKGKNQVLSEKEREAVIKGSLEKWLLRAQK